MISVQAAVEKWQRNMINSAESIKAGINSVTESPTAKAAQQADRYLAGVQRAVASGKWQNGLNAVSLQSWKDSVIAGIPSIASGVTKAKNKMTNFLSQFLPYVDAAAQQVRQMPKGGVENGIARASAMIRALANFKKT